MRSGSVCPVPERPPGIAALDRAIEIVPMVEHAQRQLGRVGDVELMRSVAAGLDQAQQREGAIEHADIAVGGDDGHAVDHAPVRMRRPSLPSPRQLRCVEDDRAVRSRRPGPASVVPSRPHRPRCSSSQRCACVGLELQRRCSVACEPRTGRRGSARAADNAATDRSRPRRAQRRKRREQRNGDDRRARITRRMPR